ncbi:MAG: hypothetical protein CVV64_07670 [Candidatus Wallbacteria bacterium HGW-Wallbacteria-1]|jgi:bifunctional UDP-N-acetylglucosamine pyrophosphorylase/glucosamine-1-phosphate N-acetyltransferase|uniref:Uncharacterized protein n=1 Tax=Candidatus Wallbacteria bacterium HGW-Wallbacteria-1 TaxID=2013854 RepID=A0A2N1PQX6_9BACT|nr:MAG: hypothetical protein CVV64_07670 [Candidatus Wallbacteria bacterium HGW-Wallbacteria-1]
MGKIQAVILCAGKSTRTYPLTLTRPKPLLQMAGATLLEYTLFQLQGLVDEVILVCGYMRQSLEAQVAHIQETWAGSAGFEFTFVEQQEQLGTAHAILQAESAIRGDFFVLNGDDLYGRGDLEAMVGGGPQVLVQEIPDVSRFSSLTLNDQGRVTEVVEKPPQGGPGIAGLGMYLFEPGIFEHIRKTPLSSRGEYEITETLNSYLKDVCLRVHTVKDFWIPIGYPWSVISASMNLMTGPFYAQLCHNLVRHLGFENLGDGILVGPSVTIDPKAIVKGPLIIGGDTRILGGASVSGPGFIGKNVRIGANATVCCSCLFDEARIGSESSFIFSLAGRGCQLGSNIDVESRPHGGGLATSVIKGVSEETGMTDLGCILADGARVENSVCFASGVKVWPEQTVESNVFLQADLEF